MAFSLTSPWTRLSTHLALPVLVKEMRSRMRGVRAQVLLFCTTGLAILIGLLILSLQWDNVSYDLANSYQMGSRMAEIGRSLFIGLMILEGILCALLAPAMTAGAISVEREQQTLDLLLLTRLSPANIALGKLVSSLSYLAIILLCALPVGAISFLLGGVDPGQFCWSLLLILSVVIVFGAIGLYCSARFKKTATSVALAYCLALGWLAFLPLGYGLLQLYQGGMLENTLITLALLIVLLLVLSIAPASIITVVARLIARHRLSRATVLIIWGLCAAGVCLLLHLPNATTLLEPEALLFGNPVVAFVVIMHGDIDAVTGSLPPAVATLLQHFYYPATALLQLLGAWIFAALTVGRLQDYRTK